MYCYNDKKFCCVTKKIFVGYCNKTKFDKKYLLPNKIFCYTNRMVSTIFFFVEPVIFFCWWLTTRTTKPYFFSTKIGEKVN